MDATWGSRLTDQEQPSPPPPPSEWQKQWWREAEREHDRQDAQAENHKGQLEAFALQGIRTLGLTSAGGVAAVLGFYSANYARLSETPYALSSVNKLLGMLFLAMLATLLTCLFGYFSQVFFAAAVHSRVRHWDHPYIKAGPKTERYILYGNITRTLAIVASLFAAICLLMAGLDFLVIVR